MTISEAIQSFPGLSDVSEDYLTKVLTDRSVTGTASYTLDVKADAELCAADLYMAIVASPDFSEGKFSLKYPRGYLLSMARSLYENNGEAANASKVAIGKSTALKKWW
ncbi:MAG: hypothetical protein AVO38_15945 [delta proteobacterium ML8_D]|jgi:hypothetical protein|nr:MAG: hypothetical protein AVO38_15945 [delta proteobacterium ML8_D]